MILTRMICLIYIANLNHEQTTSCICQEMEATHLLSHLILKDSGGFGGLQRKITNSWTEYLKNHGVKDQRLGSESVGFSNKKLTETMQLGQFFAG